MKKRFIIIGTSAAGISCANRLRQLDKESDIICISDEIESPYNKCMLADYLSGIKQEQEVFTLTIEQAQQKNIELMLSKKVMHIDTRKKCITLHDDVVLHYDALMLGIGTSPRLPMIESIQNKKNIFTFHRLHDIEAILSFIKKTHAKKAIIIGSGLSGLECADALLAHGIQSTVIEQKDRVLSTQVDSIGSDFIQQKMRECGVDYIVNATIDEYEIKDTVLSAIKLRDGRIESADLFIFAIGLQPNLDLARASSIAIQSDGIITNDYMQTSAQYIYAAGDIALVRDQLSEQLVVSRTWPDAMLQGLIAAHAMCGQEKKYPGVAAVVSSSFFGIKFASCGPVIDSPISYERIIVQEKDFYHLFLIENGLLKGFLLVGTIGIVGKLRQLLLTKALVTREKLMNL